jgi:phosphoglucosamine mutase
MENKYFGTDGVRGVANETLTAAMAYRIGRCLGQYPAGTKNKILLCRDTRLSSDMLASALIAGLLASGSEVYDEGVCTTPSVSYLVRADRFDFGVMISASHNPFSDNGIKIFNREGEKLEAAIEGVIEEYMDRPADNLPLPQGAGIGHLHDGTSLKEKYIAWLVSKNTAGPKGLRVVVDCANGSASSVAPELYEKIGLKATFIHASPNGININAECGSTHLESLEKAYQTGSYDLAFAFDGDSDRFMAIGPKGRLIDGDAMIYLNALSLRKKGLLHDNKVVMTVMSNFGLRKALDEAGIGYVIVPVGDKNVQAELKKEGLAIGGEQSGHVIFLDDLNTGDGLLSSLKLLDLFIEEPEIYKDIDKFVVYPQELKNVRFASHEALEKAVKDPGLLALQKEAESQLAGTGRLLVRASGTEPLLRIMAEATSKELCLQVINRLADYASKEH